MKQKACAKTRGVRAWEERTGYECRYIDGVMKGDCYICTRQPASVACCICLCNACLRQRPVSHLSIEANRLTILRLENMQLSLSIIYTDSYYYTHSRITGSHRLVVVVIDACRLSRYSQSPDLTGHGNRLCMAAILPPSPRPFVHMVT